MSERLVIRAVGDQAVVAELSGAPDVRRLVERLRAVPPLGTLDLVPGARTLLVRVAPGTDLTALARAIRDAGDAADDPPARPPGPPLVIDVRYDGADLDEVAQRTGLTRSQVVSRHADQSWTVAFMGFAPGFGYLVGGDERLRVPRREHPRRAVPAGAVALAGEYSGIYPRESPGGWLLLGTTDAVLWDAQRDPPALLNPGTSVRFRECR